MNRATTANDPRAAGVALAVLVTVGMALALLSLARGARTPAPVPGPAKPAPAENPAPAPPPAPSPALAPPITREQVAAAGLTLRDAMHWEPREDGMVRCVLCPTRCVLRDGERGQCRVRANYGGKLYSLVFGAVVALHVDPMEKKPLFHFYPGRQILSLATAGCNLGCRFCQNWSISQAFPEKTPFRRLMPAQIVDAARKNLIPAIAYTYTEPSVYYEYMLETARLARAAGLKNVLVSCGYMNEKPLRELAKVMDAANVDLKGFSEDFYREYCNARLQPVLDALKILREEKVHVEITNLVIPGGNDDPDMIRRMCQWIRKEMGAETPTHFSRYHPDYKMERPGPTPASTLEMAARIAREEGLKNVYIGNIATSGGEDTLCPNCAKVLIRRYGFTVRENALVNGCCPNCGHPIVGEFPGGQRR